jgi:hypothetical protein
LRGFRSVVKAREVEQAAAAKKESDERAQVAENENTRLVNDYLLEI